MRPTALRNTRSVVDAAQSSYTSALRNGLMQVSLGHRDGKRVTLPGGHQVVEFINCSYLGLDLHPGAIARGQQLLSEWGTNFCCARSRFTIGPLTELEEGLSSLWRGRAITFPSVSTTHMSTMPLLAQGLLNGGHPSSTTFLFDRLAHASMQFLRPILAAEHRVEMLPHNDLNALEVAVKHAHVRGDEVIYVADGVYSMGGLCPIEELLALSGRLSFGLYIDDAHGTSIYGERGEGTVLSRLGALPANVAITFSLSKGYGCNGGGVLLPDAAAEAHVRTFGQTYAFSAALDFSVVGASQAVLELHRDDTVRALQATLWERVALYDQLMGLEHEQSPIRMVPIGDSQRAIDVAAQLKDLGFFVSVVFFPIVARGAAQLRLCLAANHQPADIEALVAALKQVGVA